MPLTKANTNREPVRGLNPAEIEAAADELVVLLHLTTEALAQEWSQNPQHEPKCSGLLALSRAAQSRMERALVLAP